MNNPTAAILAKLAAAEWHILQDETTALLPDGTLARYILLDRAVVASCADYLRAYTDAKNSAAALPYVDNPTIDQVVRTGRWRGGEVRIEEVPPGRESSTPELRLVQILRFTGLTTLDTAHARLVEADVRPENTSDGHGQERAFTVRWKNILPDSLWGLAAGVGMQNASTNPTYRKWDGSGTVTITGTFQPVKATAKLEEDGSGTLDVLYADTRITITSFTDNAVWSEAEVIYHYNVPKVLTQGIIDAWKVAYPKGSSAQADRQADTSLFTLTLRRRVFNVTSLADQNTGEDCNAVETTSYYWGVEEANLGSYDIPGTVNDGETYTRQVKNNGDGSFDVVITKTVRGLRDIPVYTSQQDASQTTTSKQFKGVTNRVSQLGTYLNAPATGEIRRWTMSKLNDCTEDWEVDTITVTDQTGSRSVKSGFETVTVTTHTENASPVTAATAAEGVIEDAENQPTPSGRTATKLTNTTSTERLVASHTVGIAPSGTTTEKAGKNVRAANITVGAGNTYDMTSETGKVKTLEKRQNPDLTFDLSYKVDVPADQTGSRTVNSGFETVTVTTHTENASTVTAAAAAEGVVETAENQPTRAGNTATSLTNVTSTERLVASHTVEIAPGVTITRKAGKNVRAANILTGSGQAYDMTSASGKVRQLTKSQNPDLTFDLSYTETAPASLQGNAITKDGRGATGTTIRTQTFIENASAAKSFAADGGDVTNPADNEIVTILNNRVMPTGLYNITITVEIVPDEGITAYTSEQNPNYTETVEIIDGATTAPTALGGSDYGSLRYTRKNGLYYGERRIRTYTGTYTSNANWESSDVTYSLGADPRDGREIKIRIVRGFTEGAADDALGSTFSGGASATGYTRVASTNGYRTGVFRRGPGAYEGIQMWKKDA